MRSTPLAIGLLVLAVPALAAERDTGGKHYKVVDKDGNTYYGDSIPPELTDYDKQVVNDHGVTIGQIEGRKTAEELEAERRAEALRLQRDLQLRADQALLATYQTVEEIMMHRDRRIELFQAQSRVTELYLRNLERQLEKLEREASRYLPYSSAEDAEMIDPSLVKAIQETKDTIARHELNLQKFKDDEQLIVARFDGDITRFKALKGL
ncbi:MAG TPA: hypothetical protein VFY03_09595 [Woeseiaceae bacterium]|nr:hypothetical protein [Woeseiaceae bacterium]